VEGAEDCNAEPKGRGGLQQRTERAQRTATTKPERAQRTATTKPERAQRTATTKPQRAQRSAEDDLDLATTANPTIGANPVGIVWTVLN
jgi:hypothetical protein